MASASRSTSSLVLVCLAQLLAVRVCLGADAGADAVTIGQGEAWSMQRHCGMGCLQNTYDGGGDLAMNIGCTWNSCYCDTVYRPQVSSYLTSCWSYYCANPPKSILTRDVSNALSIYDGYCKSVMGVAAPAEATSVPAGQNNGALPTPAATAAAPGGIAAPTTARNQTPGSTSVSQGAGSTGNNSGGANGGNSGGGFSTSDKIALGVGLGLGIPTFIVTVWMCWIQIRGA